MEEDKSRKIMIVESAMEMFREHGFRHVTILDICNKMGITRSSFYYYFKNKEAILDYYFLSTEIQIEEHLMPLLESETSYQQFIHIYQIYMKRTTEWGPEIFGQILHRYVDQKTQMLSPKDIKMNEIYKTLIQRAQEKKEIENQDPPEKIIEILVHLSVGIAAEWCNQNGNFDYSKKLRELIDRILKPVHP